MWPFKKYKKIPMTKYPRRLPKKDMDGNRLFVYQPGDNICVPFKLKSGETIQVTGVVDTNHCGLPWVAFGKETNAGFEAGLLCGVITVRLNASVPNINSVFGSTNSAYCDAVNCQNLSTKQLEDRENNVKYDYFESGQVDHWKECPSIR